MSKLMRQGHCAVIDRGCKKRKHTSSNRGIIACLVLSTGSFLSACTSAPADPVTEDPALVITAQTPTLIEGTFGAPTAPVSFHSIERAPRKVDVTIRVAETKVTIRVDSVLGEAVFDAESGQLSPAQIGALDQMIAALTEVLASKDTAPTTAEETLERSLSYLSAAPPSTMLPTFTAASENGWVHLSCRCGRQHIGRGHYRQAGKGESCGSSEARHCPGRCGKGCGPDNLKWPWAWGSGTYTQDCALHDYGLGSWGAAFDDYQFSRKNCG